MPASTLINLAVGTHLSGDFLPAIESTLQNLLPNATLAPYPLPVPYAIKMGYSVSKPGYLFPSAVVASPAWAKHTASAPGLVP